MDKFSTWIDRHNHFLANLIEKAEIPSPRLKEALLYTLFPGGKRLRPLLIYLCGEVVNLDPTTLDSLSASMELMHSYSLVHDDLPAMDNDDFRRGKLACHRKFDEATAILTGDALQTLAFSTLTTEAFALDPEKKIKVIHHLAIATGASGMVAGQSLDLTELIKPDLALEELFQIHHFKTGKLFEACIEMVLAAATPEPQIVEGLTGFARHFGFAFQLQDDYLDAYAAVELSGKNRASDAANQKRTFAYYFDQQQLLEKTNACFDLAAKALILLEQKGQGLLDLIDAVKGIKAFPVG